MSDRPPADVPSSRHGASFLELLVQLHEERQTGVVEVRADEVLTVVYLRDGVPVSVEAGILGHTIGRVLRDEGMLTEDQLRQVIDKMTERLFHDEHVRFGEVAVAMGILTLDQINEALTAQVRQRVIHCMQWDDAQCDFKASPDALQGISPFPCAVEPLVLAGVKQHYEADRIDAMLRFVEGQYPLLCARPDQIQRRFELTPDELKLVRTVNGRTQLRDLVASAPLDEHHARQLVVALLLSKKLELRAEPRAETEPPPPSVPAPAKQVAVPTIATGTPTVDQPPPEFAVPPAAEDRPAARPLRPRAKSNLNMPRVRPAAPAPRPADPPSPEPPSQREPTPSTAAGAAADGSVDLADLPPLPDTFEVATDTAAPSPTAPAAVPPADDAAPPRAAVSVKRDRLLAEKSFGDGKANLRNGRYHQAAEQLARALELHPEAVEYQLYAAWAELCVADSGADVGDRRERLAELVTKALRENRRFAFAHYVRGQLALAKRDYPAAAASFARAVKIDPSDGDAKRHFVIARRRMKK